MKKLYVTPSLELIQTIATEHICVYGPGSMPGEPGAGGGLPAPARRITVLGSIGGGAGLGSLGSIGHVK